MPAMVSSAAVSTWLPSVLILWATSCWAAVFNEILQRLVEYDALFGIDGQLVDQRVLRGDLVVETVNEGLEHRGVTLVSLALGQEFLLLGLLLIIFRCQNRTLAFKLRAGNLVGRGGDLVFDIHQHRVEFLDALLGFLQIGDRCFPPLDHLKQACLRGLVALIENTLLLLQDADNGVGLGEQLCRLPASDMLRTRSVRMRWALCLEKIPMNFS